MSEGASTIPVGVSVCQPLPPDIAKTFECPGSQLLPCTPDSPTDVKTGRTQYALKFLGRSAAIRRIGLSIPIQLEEIELEQATTKGQIGTIYKTETEAKEAQENIGGRLNNSLESTPIGPDARFEETNVGTEIARFGTQVDVFTTTATSRSVLPITPTVVARIIGEDGVKWAGSFDVPVRWASGVPGKAIGLGVLEAYADLVNPLELDSSKTYGLELLVFIPTPVKTNTRLGLTPGGEPGPGLVTIFYDLEEGTPNK